MVDPCWAGPAGTPHTRGQDQNAEPDKIKRCAVHPGSMDTAWRASRWIESVTEIRLM